MITVRRASADDESFRKVQLWRRMKPDSRKGGSEKKALGGVLA
jgi:hypothetical protein